MNGDYSLLIPYDALSYLNDGKEDNRLYLRATSVRNCLENIVETIYLYILNDSQKVGWKKKNLHKKIQALEDFFPEHTSEKIHEIRKLGNKGAHQAGHKELKEEDIQLAIMDLAMICEWTILEYLKKNNFIERNWVPTIFSTLPPQYRVRILKSLIKDKTGEIDSEEMSAYLDKIQKPPTIEPLFRPASPLTTEELKFGGFLLLIEKLSLAYLKNKEIDKGYKLLEDMLEEGKINNIFYQQMAYKLEQLQSVLNSLPISQDMVETRLKLEKILPSIKEEDKSLFITLLTAIVSEEYRQT